MKKPHTAQTPTYVFIVLAVLLSWGLALGKAAMVASAPEIAGTRLPWAEWNFQFILAFLF